MRARATHTSTSVITATLGSVGGRWRWIQSDSSADVTDCTRVRHGAHTRFPRARRGRHPVVDATVARHTYTRTWKRGCWCCWAAVVAVAATTMSTPPRQSARPFRRLVGVDKVSHRGRHLTTNTERFATTNLLPCAQWPHTNGTK